jgi:site-specific DNA-methyltransferase (adenine-specific)
VIEPLYDDGAVSLYQGDCRDVLSLLAGRHGAAAHVLTDPPYSKRTHAGARTMKGDAGPRSFIDFADADMSMVREVLELAGAERWSIAFVDHVHAAALEVAPPSRLRPIRTGVWIKPDCAPQMNGKCPANGFESIAILHTAAPMRWNSGGKRGVWTHGVERDVPWHPTPKPVGLLRELLRDFTDPGDLVVDPFGGSGSTAVACRAEGRRCVSIELDAGYCDLAAQRLREGRARPVDRSMPAAGEKQGALFGGDR